MIFFGKGERVFKLVEQHFEDVVECYGAFVVFMEGIIARESPERMEELYKIVDALEGEADHVRRNLIPLLSGTVLSTTRGEILNISQSVDKIANMCQGISRKILVEKITVPAILNDDIKEILKQTEEQLNMLSEAISQLFNDYKKLEDEDSMLKKIKTKESEVDILENNALKKLFSLDITLAEKMHCSRSVDALCDISDHIEDIADHLQVMVVMRKG